MSGIQPTINPSLPLLDSQLERLCRLIREEKVILWVGSGFSSYAGYPTGTQLTAIMLSSLGYFPGNTPDPSTPSLENAADFYVKHKGRERLNAFLIEQFGKEPSSCDLHDSLARINRIKYIVTTNYDPLFERAYGDRIVVVSRDDDLPASTEYPDKTILLKIHGDISHPDSIVITSEDYNKFDADTIIWSKIRSLLAEYSVVFIGYSLHDSNVEKMLHGIYTRLKGKKHPYFFITRKIDGAKQKDLAFYNLHFIEMDTATSIDYITGNAIQFSYLDCMRKPELFLKSDQIFDKMGKRFDPTISGGKVKHLSMVSTRPNVPCEFKVTIASKTTDTPPQLLAFQKLITGESFDPVTLTDSECNITIRDGEVNGIFFIDPSIQYFPSLSISPTPAEGGPVDLQIQNDSIRISNLEMKIFVSEILSKCQIEDLNFTLTLTFPKGKREGTLNLSMHHIASDIERGRLIYNLFDRWMHGEVLELLTDRLPSPILIPFPLDAKIPANSPPIHALYQLYTDLSDIQRILRLKIHLPSTLSPEECRTIQYLAAFVRGRCEKVDLLPTTIGNTDQMRKIVAINEPAPFRIEGEDDRLKDKYELFGRTLIVPFVLEGSNVIIANVEEVQEEIKRGETELHLNWKSVTGEFCKKFNPHPSISSLPPAKSDEKSLEKFSSRS